VKKLDKFVLKSFTGPLVLTFFIVLIILLLQFLWMYIDELAGKGLEINILAELLFQFALSFVPTALPLGILLAALMTFGNMGEFSELTAMKSSGISLIRIMRPLMVLIALLVLLAFFFSNYILPYSNRQARMLLFDIRRKRPDINLQAGSFNNDIDGFSIKITSKDPVTNRLDKLLIYDHRERRGNVSYTFADSGYIKVTPDESALVMQLFNGYSYSEIDEKNEVPADRKYPIRKDHFKEQTIVLALTGFDLERSGNELFQSNSWMLNMKQLRHFIDSLGEEYTIRQNTQFLEYNNNRVYMERFNLSAQARQRSWPDTVSAPASFRTYELYDSLFNSDRMTVAAKALENIRDTRSYINDIYESMKYQSRSMNKYKIDWHKKLTLPFACLVFFFIGAPLGAIIRKGGLGTPAVISIFFFVIWYVISLSGEKLVEESIVNTIAGMWASSFILLPIGIFLTYKASNDSVIMNIDTYLAFFKKIKDYLYRITFQVRANGSGKKQRK